MSRFVDAMGKVGQDAPVAMGFGPGARSSEISPQILLVGRLTPKELAKSPDMAGAKVDALLMWLDSWDEGAVDKVADHLKDRLWGARVGAIDAKQAESLRNKGCDFVIFDADGTEAGVLDDEEIGKVISVTSELDEDVARAVNDLSIDGAFYAPDDDIFPLTVRRVIDLGLVRGLLDKYFIMAVPTGVTAADLGAMVGGGIAAVAVELSSASKVAKLKKTIDGLPPRKTGHTHAHRDALISFATGAPEAGEAAPDEEDFEEDDF